MKKYALKSKEIAFKTQVPVIMKIVADCSVLEQLSTFIYLGCEISHEEDRI
jgi:hypothetical protein